MTPSDISTASKDRIVVMTTWPPYVKGGFRSGDWTVFVNGDRHRVYASVSAYATLEEQERHVASVAKRKLNLNTGE